MTNHVSKYLAVIDEDNCIGCTLCVTACPFDAIIGAARHMHTVITEFCTGCKLCVSPCPVDCIEMVENTSYLHKIAKPAFKTHTACVDCGHCAPACPSKIQPDQIYAHLKANQLNQAIDSQLEACTLCGDCDAVCPSNIPLAATFRYGLASLDLKNQKKQFARDVKQRAARREDRIASVQSFKLNTLADQKNNIDDFLARLKPDTKKV